MTICASRAGISNLVFNRTLFTERRKCRRSTFTVLKLEHAFLQVYEIVDVFLGVEKMRADPEVADAA